MFGKVLERTLPLGEDESPAEEEAVVAAPFHQGAVPDGCGAKVKLSIGVI